MEKKRKEFERYGRFGHYVGLVSGKTGNEVEERRRRREDGDELWRDDDSARTACNTSTHTVTGNRRIGKAIKN